MRKKKSDELFNSNSFLKYRKKIVQEVLKYSKQIDSVQPPLGNHTIEYDLLLRQGAEYKGGGFWYPYIGSGIGNGAYVEMEDGSVKIDLISGIGVHYLGHSSHGVILHSLNGAISNTVHNGHLQQNKDSIKLMESFLKLANRNNHAVDHCFLSTSGAIANENALKIAFQRKAGSDRIICFEKCFAGRTLATACMTDKAGNRVGLPNALKVDYVPFYDEHNPNKTLDAIQKLIDRYPNQYAAMCMELVQGEGGYNTANTFFFQSLGKMLKENNIAFWVDEIQTFGRTYKPFAFQYYKLADYVDIITVGKASQVCATLFTKDFKPKPGLLSQTFTSTSVAIKSSQYILDYMEKNYDKLFREKDDGDIFNIRDRFDSHVSAMNADWGDNVIKLGLKGIGGMIAVEMFNGDLAKSIDFTKKLFNNGVISFIAGKNPTRIRFLPPVNIKIKTIDEAMKIFDETIGDFIGND
jgi:4-aminobutyrate aminotransferase-like enzyme